MLTTKFLVALLYVVEIAFDANSLIVNVYVREHAAVFIDQKAELSVCRLQGNESNIIHSGMRRRYLSERVYPVIGGTVSCEPRKIANFDLARTRHQVNVRDHTR